MTKPSRPKQQWNSPIPIIGQQWTIKSLHLIKTSINETNLSEFHNSDKNNNIKFKNDSNIDTDLHGTKIPKKQ